VKAVIANAIVERSNADKLRNDFLASIKALDLELYTRCAAVAGLPLGGGGEGAGHGRGEDRATRCARIGGRHELGR
jgi:hypothetical protein